MKDINLAVWNKKVRVGRHAQNYQILITKVIMKKYFITINSFLLPLMAMANGAHEEDPSITHQLEEFLPLEHLEHGHWFAAVLSILLWASLIYIIYSFIQKFRKLSQ